MRALVEEAVEARRVQRWREGLAELQRMVKASGSVEAEFNTNG